jgi:hypothetical protein
MRAVRCLALAAAIAWSVPAAANTIVEDIAFSGSVANGPAFVTGPLFNPALGTLTGVSVAVTGQYELSVFTLESGLPPIMKFALQGIFEPAGADVSLPLGTFYATTANRTNYTGMAAIGFTGTLGDIGDYVAGSPDATSYLAGLGFDAFPANHIGLGGDADDNSTWSGSLAVTYTYDVPEPGSIAILGLAALLAMCLGRRAERKTRPLP